MRKLTAKDITESYNRLKAKPRGKRRNKMIERVCIDLLCSIQNKELN
jgi:hypothetical protein